MECGAHAVLQKSDFFAYFEEKCHLGGFNDSGSQNYTLTNNTTTDSLFIMKDNAKGVFSQKFFFYFTSDINNGWKSCNNTFSCTHRDKKP